MSEGPVPLSPKELTRKRRVLDQMLTGHAWLRDVYERRALLLTLLILALSILATAVAFLNGESHLKILGATARVQIWVGSLTALIFFLSLIDLRVDWRQRAGAHAEATRRLGTLKGLFRGVVVIGDEVQAGGVDVDREYDAVMERLPPIPEKWFLRVKAKHLRKVRASELLDSHSGAPAWWVRLVATWNGIRGSKASLDNGGQQVGDAEQPYEVD